MWVESDAFCVPSNRDIIALTFSNINFNVAFDVKQ